MSSQVPDVGKVTNWADDVDDTPGELGDVALLEHMLVQDPSDLLYREQLCLEGGCVCSCFFGCPSASGGTARSSTLPCF